MRFGPKLVCLLLAVPAGARAQSLPVSQPASARTPDPASQPTSTATADRSASVQAVHPASQPDTAPSPTPFVFSAVGPGARRGAASVGLGVLLIAPLFEFNYIYGVTPTVAVHGRLDAAVGVTGLALGSVLGDLSLGVRYLATSYPRSAFAFRAGLTTKAARLLTQFGALPGLEAGIIMSGGGPRAQGSLSLDGGPLFGFLLETPESGLGFVRVALTAEFPRSGPTGAYLQALGLLLFRSVGPVPLPGVAFGFSW
jgi:hypothetical protein